MKALILTIEIIVAYSGWEKYGSINTLLHQMKNLNDEIMIFSQYNYQIPLLAVVFVLCVVGELAFWIL